MVYVYIQHVELKQISAYPFNVRNASLSLGVGYTVNGSYSCDNETNGISGASCSTVYPHNVFVI